MTIQFLVSTHKETINALLDHIINNVVGGDVIVCNQQVSDNSLHVFHDKGRTITIYNSTKKGVSISRNFLLKKSTADFVAFLDNDISITEDAVKIIKNSFSINSTFKALKFNVLNTTSICKKERNISFFDIKNHGCWGYVFNRLFLLNNGLLFDEKIGPGTDYPCGEDTIFLYNLYKKTKIKAIPLNCFSLQNRGIESTWSGSNRDVKKELASRAH